MASKYSAAVHNAMLDAYEVAIGAAPILEIRSGAPPTNETDADSGTLLASIALPSDWLTAASARSKAKSGTWEDASADGAGTAGHFRIKSADGTVTHHQGTVTITGGGGDMTVDNPSFQPAQVFTVTGFALSMSN